jgi:endonuclease/exonuclease/phosphatase family metal-dependent hydrolase
MHKVLAACLLGMLAVAGCAASRPTELRVLTYNIHHGEGLDKELDLERIAAVIREARPDLVALQEVDRGVRRSGGVDQPAELGRLTGMHAVFEKNIPLEGGEYGNAILSRYPLRGHRNHHLPQIRPHEQRGVLEAQVEIRGRRVTLLATHFDHRPDDTERMASLEQVRGLVEERSGEVVVLAGDLNDFPTSRALTEAATMLEVAHPTDGSEGLSFPADAPDRRIDYILYRAPAGAKVVECHVLPESVASDHRPVLAVIQLRPAKK